MTKEQKDKLIKALADERNEYVRGCTRAIAEEHGKVTGADYMLRRFLDILEAEIEPQESEVEHAEALRSPEESSSADA